MATPTEKRITFGLQDAFRLGYHNVRRRFSREVLVLAAIALGITFFSTLSFMDSFYRIYTQTEGGSLQVESYQYWLVLVSLGVCVVSITNATIISVYERYREIGTMKCIGALDQHILKLFLVESFIVALIGGVLGYVLGFVASIASVMFSVGVGVIFKASFSVYVTLFLQTISLSLVLSMVATVYPAYRAAKLNPVEALRYEI